MSQDYGEIHMRYLGKSALCLSALAITLLVGSPLQAEENHSHKHNCTEQMHEKASSHCKMHKEAKGDDAKAGCCAEGCCDHAGKEAKAGDKPCADHAGCCKDGEANAKTGDKATCADEGCCKDGCHDGDGKACADHEEAHAH